MAADASAYAALGLEPGADAADIDRAYKRLIKQHHPDRAGGDPARAAEINRAYRQLRGPLAKDPLELDVDVGLDPDRPVRAAILLLAAAGILGILLISGPIRSLAQATSPGSVRSVEIAQTTPAADLLNQPLELAAIDQGIRDAVRIARNQDEIALAGASRDCHRRLHRAPTVARLDRCAAFDDAVIQLQNRDPLRDRGPFSELAVTGRLMSGGTLFSGDYLTIDSRLDRIRLQVELALAPPPPPPVVEASETKLALPGGS